MFSLQPQEGRVCESQLPGTELVKQNQSGLKEHRPL